VLNNVKTVSVAQDQKRAGITDPVAVDSKKCKAGGYEPIGARLKSMSAVRSCSFSLESANGLPAGLWSSLVAATE
jgi:hypothetical protein